MYRCAIARIESLEWQVQAVFGNHVSGHASHVRSSFNETASCQTTSKHLSAVVVSADKKVGQSFMTLADFYQSITPTKHLTCQIAVLPITDKKSRTCSIRPRKVSKQKSWLIWHDTLPTKLAENIGP